MIVLRFAAPPKANKLVLFTNKILEILRSKRYNSQVLILLNRKRGKRGNALQRVDRTSRWDENDLGDCIGLFSMATKTPLIFFKKGPLISIIKIASLKRKLIFGSPKYAGGGEVFIGIYTYIRPRSLVHRNRPIRGVILRRF